MRLSADGAYFATHTSSMPRTTDIWRLSDAKQILRIPDGSRIPDMLDFVGTDKLVTGTSYARTLDIYDFKNNRHLFTIQTPDAWGFKRDSLAISPGGNYLAAPGGRASCHL